MMKFEKVKTSYSVEIDIDVFRKKFTGYSEEQYSFLQDLIGIGLQEIDWDGMFGPYLFFAIDVEDDTEEFHQKILNKIQEYLEAT